MIPPGQVPIPRQTNPLATPAPPDNADLFFKALQANQDQQKIQLDAQKVLTDSVMSMSKLMEAKREADMENAQKGAMLDFYKSFSGQGPTFGSVNGQTYAVTPGKNGPKTQFAPTGAAGGLTPMQNTALQWGIDKGLVDPQIPRGAAGSVWAGMMMNRPDFQKDLAAGYTGSTAGDPLQAKLNLKDRTFGVGTQAQTVVRGAQSFMPILDRLEQILPQAGYVSSKDVPGGFGAGLMTGAKLAFNKNVANSPVTQEANSKGALLGEEWTKAFGKNTNAQMQNAFNALGSHFSSLEEKQSALQTLREAANARVMAYGGKPWVPGSGNAKYGHLTDEQLQALAAQQENQ